MKKFRKYALITLALLIVGVTAAYFVARAYEPQVRDLLVSELNKHLAAPVHVKDFDFSLLRRFPDASLRLSEVVIPVPGSQGTQPDGHHPSTPPVPRDTLLYIQDLYLQIGLWDFLKRDYKVTRAEVNKGFFHMEFHADGSDNFRFWQKEGAPEDESTEGRASIRLQDVKWLDFGYTLRTAEGLDLAVEIKRANTSGDFGQTRYDIDTDTDLRIDRVAYKGDTLYDNTAFSGPLKVEVDAAAKRYDFSGENVDLAGENFRLQGSFDGSKATPHWHVEFRTEKADIDKLTSLIPQYLRSGFSKYSAKGKTDLDLVIDSGEDFALDAVFDEMDGSFKHIESLGRATVNQGAGSVQVRGGKTSLYIDQLDGEIGAGDIAVRGKIVDFSAPTFDLYLQGDIDLAALKDLLNITRIEIFTGQVALNGRLTGHLSRGYTPEEKVKLLRGMDFSGSLSLNNGGYKAAGRSELFEDLQGRIELKNNAIYVHSATGQVNGNKFELEGAIQNALPFISEAGQKLHIAADFKSPMLDLNAIWAQEPSANRDTSYSFALPRDVSFDLSVDVALLEFRKFTARQVRGKAYYKNGVLTLNPVSFGLASGQVQGSLIVSENADKYVAEATVKAKHLEIDGVFTAFENFGQSVIRSENIAGLGDLDLDFRANFGSDLHVDPASVEARADLSVKNGQLKNLESLKQVAEYIRSNPLWNTFVKVDALEKNLETVAFDDLKNSIVISDQTVTIPEMTLGNSALTLDVVGQYRFDNTMDYSLSFRLGELLRTGKKRDSDFGYIADDGTGLRLYLHMYGNTADPQFAMDKQAARRERQDRLQQEKNNVKNILKSEFGLFKSDSALTGVRPPAEGPKTKFEVQWDGGEKSEGAKKTDDDKAKNPAETRQKTPAEKDPYEELDKDDDL